MLGRSDTASAQRYAEAMQSILTHLTDGFSAEAVNVVVAHTHVSGAVLATHDRSERSVHLGDDWAVSPQAFPASASYVALGHIHKPQDLPAAVARTCYAGSALQLDFGEAGEEKSFVVIDVEPRRPPQVSRVPYQGGTPLVDLTLASVQELRSRAGDLATDEAYLRVTVTDSTEAHDLNREVRELLPNAVAVRVPETDPSEDENESSIDRSLLSPRQLYAVYCRRTRSQEPGEALLDEFDILHRDAGGR
jgi:exonuclease SbcD